MRLTTLRHATLLSFLLAVPAGCDAPRCVEGSTQACACLGGVTGVQTCVAGGTFGVCNCGPEMDAVDAGVRDDASTDGAAGDGGGPVNCSAISPPAGFTRSPITSFQELRNENGFAPQPFPNSGGGFSALSVSRQQYVSIAFTVPSPFPPSLAKNIRYTNVTYLPPGASYVNVANNYVTISECPGDFRIPPALQDAPATDPTFAEGCRSWRAGNPGQRVNYLVRGVEGAPDVPSDSQNCHLELGRTYYYNMILDGPGDGQIDQAGTSNGCQQPTATECGFALRYD